MKHRLVYLFLCFLVSYCLENKNMFKPMMHLFH